MFRSRIRPVWGHAAIFAWSYLILDRSRKLVCLQPPAACATRAGGDSYHNFEKCGLFQFLSPDTGCGVTPIRGGRTGTLALGVSVSFSGEV